MATGPQAVHHHPPTPESHVRHPTGRRGGHLRSARLRAACARRRTDLGARKSVQLQQQGRQPPERDHPEGHGSASRRLCRQPPVQADGNRELEMAQGRCGNSPGDGGSNDARRGLREVWPARPGQWCMGRSPPRSGHMDRRADAALAAVRTQLWLAVVAAV